MPGWPVRVVCAACGRHYADIADGLPREEMLVWSDELAADHAPTCAATRDEHAAGVAWMQAMDTALESS